MSSGVFLTLLAWAFAGIAVAEPPQGFVYESIGDSWNTPVGVVERFDGHLVVWEREGKLWLVEPDGTRGDAPWLDIADEVGGWRDHGLLGVALHPNFQSNGWVYLLYVVDRHHLYHYGTNEYDATTNEYFEATVGRISRYTATIADGFASIDPLSRRILLGKTPTTGFPILYESHSVGSLHFGDDGTLLASMGDSANYGGIDDGGPFNGGYVTQALNDGILGAHEDVGSYRSQMIESLCGKILRLNAVTGAGIASNPYFESDAPYSTRSRVWTLGLRNPFRWSIIPGTGSHLPEDGDPGTLLVGDVGSGTTEELTFVDRPALNLGWPFFEGLTNAWGYAAASPEHPMAENPLADGESCPDNFNFRNLIVQDTQQKNLTFFNPCAVLEAEDAQYSGAEFRNSTPGYLGAGYIDFQNPTGDWLQWTFQVSETGTYDLVFRYALGLGESRPLRLEIDGVVVDPSMSFPSTAGFHEWRTHRTTVRLDEGTHQAGLHAIGSSGANFDCLVVVRDGTEAQFTVPKTIPTFTHHRSLVDWRHGQDLARAPYYLDGAAYYWELGSNESEVLGAPFRGNCALGGPLLGGEESAWPDAWHGAFFGDYVAGWIRCVEIDESGVAQSVSLFETGLGGLTFLGGSWDSDELFVARLDGTLRRYRWDPKADEPPTARVVTSIPYGPTPHSMDFDATSSTDPEKQALSFEWDFGDGSEAGSGATVTHVFTAPDATPLQRNVTLTVRDAAGGTDTFVIVVSVNNTPPTIEILSPLDGALYSMEHATTVALSASIQDEEHDEFDLTCEWILITHHNAHEHPEPTDDACASAAHITPIGCGHDLFWYECELTVTDAHGLSTTVSSDIFPDCDGTLVCPADLNDDAIVDGADLALVLSGWGRTSGDINGDQNTDGADLALVLVAWGGC